MRSLSFLIVLLVGIFQLVSAQNSNAITVPPNGFVVTAGQPTTIEWTNPSPRTVTIQLVPASGTGSIITLGSVLPNNGSATLLIPSDIHTTQQYKFKITDDSNSSNVNFSPAFDISPPPSGTLSTSTAATSGAAATGVSTSTGSSTLSSHHGLSTGTIAGISIGVALAVLLLLAGVAFFFYRRRRKHKTWMQQQQPTANERAPAYDMTYQYSAMHPQMQPTRETVIPMKATDQWAVDNGDGLRGVRELSEVSGSRSFPREMEAMSRFQQREVQELPASPIDEGVQAEKK